MHFLVAPEYVALRVRLFRAQSMGERRRFRGLRIENRPHLNARILCELREDRFGVKLILRSVENNVL